MPATINLTGTRTGHPTPNVVPKRLPPTSLQSLPKQQPNTTSPSRRIRSEEAEVLVDAQIAADSGEGALRAVRAWADLAAGADRGVAVAVGEV